MSGITGHSLRFDRDGAVATIAIDRAGEMNRFRPEDLARLGEIVEALRSDDETQAVIVTGTGDVFSYGLLNPEIRARLPKEAVLDIVFLANRVFDALEALPQIVVAAINGPLMAGAVELALACDIRVAADNTTMMLPEAKWGGFPGAGGPVRLPVVVGYGRALELVATGRQIDAVEMERIGLVEHVWPAAELRRRADELAATIAASGPLATRGAKRIARARREPGFRAARELEIPRPLTPSPGAEIDQPVHQCDHHAAADHVAERNEEEVVRNGSKRHAFGAEQPAKRQEVHVGYRMLEAKSHEGGDREQDGQDFSGHVARRHGQPDGKADKHIAQQAANDRLEPAERRLGAGDTGGGPRHVAAAKVENAGGMNQYGGCRSANEIRRPDDCPVAHQASRRDLAVGPADDDQIVAGEQFCAGNDDEDQAERKHRAAEDALRSEAERRIAGDEREKHRAERDERTGKNAQGRQGH